MTLQTPPPSESEPSNNSHHPLILFIGGSLTGAVTAVMAVIDATALASLFGAITAILAIWLTYLIARGQGVESGQLRIVVEEMSESVRQMKALLLAGAERESAQEYGAPDEGEPEADGDRPDYSDAALERLQAQGASITNETAKWKRKTPQPPLPGNHGWFVESSDETKRGRWYVRNARGLTVRRAMPRDFLEELKKRENVDPRAIKLDFQLKEHGLTAWYARTYDGDLWKVWRPARGWDNGIKVERVDEELAADSAND